MPKKIEKLSKKEETKDNLALASVNLIQNLLDQEDKRKKEIEEIGMLIGQIRGALISGETKNVPKLSAVLIMAITRTGRNYLTNRYLTIAGNRLKWQLNRRKPRARRTLQLLLKYEIALDFAVHGDTIETEKTFQMVYRGILERISIMDYNIMNLDKKQYSKFMKLMKRYNIPTEALSQNV